jgi:hypothetical protein
MRTIIIFLASLALPWIIWALVVLVVLAWDRLTGGNHEN